MIKLIIAGGREFSDIELFDRSISEFIEDKGPIGFIISGMARGADMMGYNYGKENGIPVIEMPVKSDEWARKGKGAGFYRNEDMAKIATHLLVFWDRKSSGTRNMIALGHQYELEVTVIFV